MKRFGILPEISAYPFETKLFQIKNLLRTGHKPLAQAAKRLQEFSYIENYTDNVESKGVPKLEKQICKDDMLFFSNVWNLSDTDSYYSVLKLSGFLLKSDMQNKWFLTNRKQTVAFEFAIKQQNLIYVIGSPLKHIENYFKIPLKSSALNIYVSDCEEDSPKAFELEEIISKIVSIFEPNKKCLIFTPLLHTLIGN